MNALKKALIVGATGLIGKNLVKELIHSAKYEQIFIFTRRATEFQNETSVTEVSLDFDEIENYASYLTGVDDVFVCLGTTMKKAGSKKQFMKVDYSYPLKLGKLAEEANVERFLIVTAIGSNRDSPFFYSRVKGKLEEALVKLDIPSLHIFRPSLLVGEREEFRLGEKTAEVIGRPLSFLLVGPFEKYKPIQGKHIAKAMCVIAQEESSGVHLYESDKIRHLGKILANK